jgi:hypothetical protein
MGLWSGSELQICSITVRIGRLKQTSHKKKQASRVLFFKKQEKKERFVSFLIDERIIQSLMIHQYKTFLFLLFDRRDQEQEPRNYYRSFYLLRTG